MKVRKEQFLLPKATKTISVGSTKWIQPNRKLCEFTKNVTVEGLPSALLTKIKPDVLLSSGEIIVSGHTGGPLVWQQQDGILRQALLNTEKDVKSEDKVCESLNVEQCQNQNENCLISGVPTNTSLLAITPVTPQQLTPITPSQVIKMNDYQVILSSEALPITWQDNGKKKNSPSIILPPIKSGKDTGFIISDQHMPFTSLGNANGLCDNQFSTTVIKEGKSSLSANVPPNSATSKQTHLSKKPSVKSACKPVKVKKKVQLKKIMLKPQSLLLSQTALDYRNKDRVESQVEVVCENDSMAMTSAHAKPTVPVSAGIDYTIKSNAEPVALVTSTSLPVSTSSIIITAHNSIHSFTSQLRTKSPLSKLPVTAFDEKCDFSESLTTVKGADSTIVYDPSSVNLIGDAVADNTLLITHSQDQDLTLSNRPVISENVLIDSSTRVMCSDNQSLLHDTMLVENTISVQSADLLRSEDYHQDHTETIVPSDIEHHEEHHTQEYTDNLLSQLSNSGVLPNMSSSQVSSVLNALAPSDKTVMNQLAAMNSNKESVKCEPTEFVKTENVQIPNNVRLKTKAAEPKYRVCEINKFTCFRCVNCMFLSLKTENVEKHWTAEHQSLRPDLLDKQVTKRPIRCLGCTDIFYSKYALQIHLLCDHNVITTEVHDLIAVTLLANKCSRDSKRQTQKSVHYKSKVSPQLELSNVVPVDMPLTLTTSTYQPNITSVITQTLTPVMETSVIMSEPAKIDEQKIVSGEEPEIPPTPIFNLFSEVQLPTDKEEIVLTEGTSDDVNNGDITLHKLLCNIEKKGPKSTRRYRSRMKPPDAGSEIKYTYSCVVERCAVRLSCVAYLNYHVRCHKIDSELLFCPECDYSVVSWYTLTPHLWREHKVDIDLYSCKLCNYKSNSYSKLINNHVKIHGDERPFLCDMCGKGFKTTKQLRNHKVIHRARRRYTERALANGELEVGLDNKLTDYVCNICGRCFSDSRVLRHHTENVHNKARPYLCTFCSHTASCKSSLRMHIRLHTGEKPFSCNECEFRTSDHNSLRRHKMRHSGMRPYQCPHCAYNCIQVTTYKSHLKNKHPGLDAGLIFSCPRCPFRTVKKDNYLAHKAEHDLGGDPRGRRKKIPHPSDIMQEQPTSLHKRLTYLPEQDDVVVLLDHPDHLPPVESQTIELIVPEASSV